MSGLNGEGRPLIFNRILVATDGTEASLRGVRFAMQMVAVSQAEFVLLTVVSMPQHVMWSADTDRRNIATFFERLADESLGSALDLLRREGIGAEVKAVFGSPPETILSEIESSGADLVVMGRGSRYEPKELVLGSVSERVARSAKVPIVLVP